MQLIVNVCILFLAFQQPVLAKDFDERTPVYGVIKPGEISTLLAVNHGMIASIPKQIGEKVRVGQIILYVIEKETSRAYRSTISGTVAKLHVTKGAAVTPGMPMVTVLNPENKIIEVSLSPEEAAHVTLGAELFLKESQRLFGKIIRISPLVDPDTGGVVSVVRSVKKIPNLIGDVIPLMLAIKKIENCKVVALNEVNKYSSNYRVIATTGQEACLKKSTKTTK